MKKSLLFLGMLALGLANAQQTTPSTTSTTPTTNGKVGINTETPTRTLDVNGDLRVRTMETLSDFNGLMVAETIGEGTNAETNVVRKAEIKGKFLLNTTSLPAEAELKISRTLTTDQTKIVDRFGPRNARAIILPAVPVAAQEYLELSADKKSYTVKKSGFYHISLFYMVKINNPQQDSFDGKNGMIRLTLTARTIKDDPNTGMYIGDLVQTIFKGASSPRQTREDGTYRDDSYLTKFHPITIAGSTFIPKGGRIAAFVYSQSMASVVENDSRLNDITLAPNDSEGRSSISISTNL